MHADPSAGTGSGVRAFRMTLYPGMKAEYQRRHEEIWPELVEALREAGVIDYRIFLDDRDGSLFAVMRHRRPHGLDELPTLSVMRRWWHHMADIMYTEADESPSSSPLDEVFALSGSAPACR
ncbi:L-rhamnose mutarotase [Halotalea alkalilenta]|uniref:L-rhamnose mutarotase n=1 Tax=Halotalea alkalilenta TaxID=376489 RepID=UPI0006948FEF|nr:L-rhamnose mutarotase [Halotalea alkalilenta]